MNRDEYHHPAIIFFLSSKANDSSALTEIRQLMSIPSMPDMDAEVDAFEGMLGILVAPRAIVPEALGIAVIAEASVTVTEAKESMSYGRIK